MNERFNRNIKLFGADGQAAIRASNVTVVGVGGLGTHVVQQLALLGVGEIAVIDSQELSETNRNRYIGAWQDDPVPGTVKVDIAERLVKKIDPSIVVKKVHDSFLSRPAYDQIAGANYVFGCLDLEGARVLLNEICASFDRPYIDLASEIHPGESLTYGGRICVSQDGNGCLMCLGVLDMEELQIDLGGPEAKRNRAKIYGLDPDALGETGPSVVSINGVVASLGVTEFMVAVTHLRDPIRLLSYHGHTGKVLVSKDDPMPNCYYCAGIRGSGETMTLIDYLTNKSLRHLRNDRSRN